jgi:hypothetical protein
MNISNPAIEITRNLEYVRSSFHDLLDELKEEDLNKPSKNPGWTNNEILAHMLFGFIIVNTLLPPLRIFGRLPEGLTKPFSWLLNSFTRPFNWINGLGARVQGKVFTGERLEKTFDQVIDSLMRKVEKINNNEWRNGMYYPDKWDSNFDEFMTLEKLFNYPIIHFAFHKNQLNIKTRI